MKKKEQTPEQKIEELCKDIVYEINHWTSLKEFGGQDPFWPDGVNMNLTRNHVIYAKREIKKICEETGHELPEAYYLGTPPEVDDGYMANLKQTKRIARLESQGMKLTLTRIKYDAEQTSLF